MFGSSSKSLAALTALAASVNGYWLMGVEDFITTERIDPVVTPGQVSTHVHSVLGGSNFRMSVNTASLRQSACTSIPIPQDKSAYWFPHLYFQSVVLAPRSPLSENLANAACMQLGKWEHYLFSDKPGTTTAFPDDFRMISGTPSLRTYDPKSPAQQAVTFLCLNFGGTSTRHNELPAKPEGCPNGIRAQINFPSCWDGKNTDAPDHKSHVAFPSGGPDSGTCNDPKFPVTVPRIFLEVYWNTPDFDTARPKAMNPSQPFVFANGDPTGYGYHADFVNGWDRGVLQRAVDNCHCNPYGDPGCCVDQGLFTMNKGRTCRITKSVDEQTTGTLPSLPGNNPITYSSSSSPPSSPQQQGDTTAPALISPVYAYEGEKPTATGKVVSTTAGTATVKPVATSTGTTAATQNQITTSAKTTSAAPATKPVNTPASTTSAPPSKGYHLVDRSSPGSESRNEARGTELNFEEDNLLDVEADQRDGEVNEEGRLIARDAERSASCPSGGGGDSKKERFVKVRTRRGVFQHHHRHAFSHQKAVGAHGPGL
ncbi:hypothetical protein FA13DRAFT_1640227 [Coprinellus micaceus]|uniref:DUF1996 domain-containing protein n=1 Tax=Coprinellus micaceus TaxID=71717 RepID=A0A4Y7SN57_COPMI|nr:hypothetical protein FA13DRAFT_1640227 [Coprinellus micaceus]